MFDIGRWTPARDLSELGVDRSAFYGLARREHELLEFVRANLAIGNLAQP
jgi:hypothetical protein